MPSISRRGASDQSLPAARAFSRFWCRSCCRLDARRSSPADSAARMSSRDFVVTAVAPWLADVSAPAVIAPPSLPIDLRRLLLWAPACTYGGIFFASSVPGDKLPATCGTSWAAAVMRARASLSAILSAEDGYCSARRDSAMAVLLATLYGAFDEVHQAFTPDRSPDVRDVVADCLGADVWGAAILLLIAIVRRLRGASRLTISRLKRRETGGGGSREGAVLTWSAAILPRPTGRRPSGPCTSGSRSVGSHHCRVYFRIAARFSHDRSRTPHADALLRRPRRRGGA